MKTINRIAIIVTPGEPYWTWARAISDDAAIVDAVADGCTSAHLVEAPDAFEPDHLIRKHFGMIFEEQLDSWHRDETAWPRRRTEAMFREWFNAKVVDMVWDLGRGPIEVDE